jgi:hypothetical protein
MDRTMTRKWLTLTALRLSGGRSAVFWSIFMGLIKTVGF